MSKKVEIFGNKDTMNLPQIIYKNILASSYFQSLKSKTKYHEVIDEIYYHVKYGVAYLGENVSVFFCLLFKLFTLKLTENQVAGLLDHTDSPFIRIAGLLYIRFATNPKNMYALFEDYLEDREEVEIKKDVHTTIGKIAIGLLKDEKYLDVLLPRIPVLIKREIQEKLDKKYPAIAEGYNGDRDTAQKRHRDRDYSAGKDSDRLENRNLNNARKRFSDKDSFGSRSGYRDIDFDRDRNRSRYGDEINSRDRNRSRYGDEINSRDRNRSRYGDEINSRDKSDDRDTKGYHTEKNTNKNIDKRKNDRDKSPDRKDDERRNRERYNEKGNHERDRRQSRSPLPANPVISDDKRETNIASISAEDKKKREEAQKEKMRMLKERYG